MCQSIICGNVMLVTIFSSRRELELHIHFSANHSLLPITIYLEC